MTLGFMSQSEFGALIGVSQQAVSEMVLEGTLLAGAAADQWLLSYCHRLREQAAGRMESGALSLSQERAALAREQRLGIEIKNGVLRGEFASVALLAEVLATASQAVAERFEQLPGTLKKTCPDITEPQLMQIQSVIAATRNEWVRSTSDLVVRKLETTDDEDPAVLSLEDEPRSD